METRYIGNEEAIQQLPQSLARLMSLERFHLHRKELFQNESRDASFDRRYFPQNCGAFKLPCYWVQRRHLYVYGCQSTEQDELKFFRDKASDEEVLFPIHPMTLSHYKKVLAKVGAEDATTAGRGIWAVPTSSTRTLLCWPDREPEKAVFVKTSLHSPIFGDRHLYLKKVGRSVGLSQLILDPGSNLPPALKCFAEPVGFVPRQLQDAGVIIRSIPQEIKNNRVLAVPLFSLMGGDATHKPVFLTLLEQSGAHPLKLIEDTLCAPFAKLWLEMTMRSGLMLEAHGQDLMLALLPNLVPSGVFFYRDFEGLQVDWELRRAYGLSGPEHMPRAWSWNDTYAGWGYRSSQLVWYKLHTSLFAYMHLVLNEINLSLCEWQGRGLLGGEKFGRDDVTMIFSRAMIRAIEEMFEFRVAAEYNIYRSLKRFVLDLMKLRLRLLRARKGS